MTREQTIDLLEIMAAAYPNAKIKDPERMVQAWQLAFGEEDAERVYKAARYHINHSKFFPTAADIRDGMTRGNIIYGEPSTAPRIEEPEAEEVWGCDQYCDDCPDNNNCPDIMLAHGGSKYGQVQDSRRIHDGDNQGHPHYQLNAEHKAQE